MIVLLCVTHYQSFSIILFIFLHTFVFAAISCWVSLCKTRPGDHLAGEYADFEDDDELNVTVETWSDYLLDFHLLAKDSNLMLPFSKSAVDIQPCDLKEATPLLALAAGAQGNDQAQRIYDNMMNLANYRGTYMYNSLIFCIIMS